MIFLPLIWSDWFGWFTEKYLTAPWRDVFLSTSLGRFSSTTSELQCMGLWKGIHTASVWYSCNWFIWTPLLHWQQQSDNMKMTVSGIKLPGALRYPPGFTYIAVAEPLVALRGVERRDECQCWGSVQVLEHLHGVRIATAQLWGQRRAESGEVPGLSLQLIQCGAGGAHSSH